MEHKSRLMALGLIEKARSDGVLTFIANEKEYEIAYIHKENFMLNGEIINKNKLKHIIFDLVSNYLITIIEAEEDK